MDLAKQQVQMKGQGAGCRDCSNEKGRVREVMMIVVVVLSVLLSSSIAAEMSRNIRLGRKKYKMGEEEIFRNLKCAFKGNFV